MGVTCVYAVELYAKTPYFCTEPVEVEGKGMYTYGVLLWEFICSSDNKLKGISNHKLN
jgi:hypothetical protein